MFNYQPESSLKKKIYFLLINGYGSDLNLNDLF